MLIKEAIERILDQATGDRLEHTVDTVKSGDDAQPLRGVAVTFTATFEAIREAAASGANLLITHEPTYYNHHDAEELFADNEVYRAKRELLRSCGMVVWRFHDYWHLHRPDGILTGVLNRLDWSAYADPSHSPYILVPEQTVRDVAERLKRRLDIPYVRLVGDPDMPCSRIGMLLGAMGGEAQIAALARPDVDVVVCGETVEWMTCEYARDAVSAGRRKALIVLGHYNSEKDGMTYLAEWLKPLLPNDIAIRYIACGDPLALL